MRTSKVFVAKKLTDLLQQEERAT